MAHRPAFHDYLFQKNTTDDEVRKLLRSTQIPLDQRKSGRDRQTDGLEGIIEKPSYRHTSKLQQLSRSILTPYIQFNGEIAQADYRGSVSEIENTLPSGFGIIEGPTLRNSHGELAKKASAGSQWFHMPRTRLTPDLKRDLQVLKMRSILDPKRHYKQENGNPKPPEFSQNGTIIQGPTEFYSSRLSKRERRNTLMGNVLTGETQSKFFMKKYHGIQAKKISGKRVYYRSVQETRLRKHT